MTRQSKIRLLRAVAVPLALSLAASLACAATVASVSGANNGLILGPANGNVVVDIQFTLPREYDNVTVAAALARPGNAGVSVVDAYLTNQVGPGTTGVNVIASNTGLSVPYNFEYAMIPLFSGPNLPAGTYHLVFGSTSGMPVLCYTYPGPAPVTLAPGVTYSYSWNQHGATFEPASTLAPAGQAFNFQITGDPAPQLGSSSLLVGAAAGSSSVLLTDGGFWTATANDSFLHISSGSASGTGNSVVAFTYDAFTGIGTRTGTLTIAGFPVTVTQAGANYLAPGPVVTLLTSGLSYPSGVAVDGAGNLYFTDTGSNAIKEWNASTQQVTTLVSSGLNGPDGIAVDGAGNVYFVDGSVTAAVKEWHASTQQVTTLVSSGLSYPHGVAVDAAGNVYIADTDNSQIKEWSASTQQVTTLVSSGLFYPNGVAVDAAGNLYISDSGANAIYEWNATTQQLTTLASSGLSLPSFVAVDGSGNVYIADREHNAIKEWSASTQQVTTLAGGLSSPIGVAVDGSGNVYIADSNNSAIKEIPNAFVGPAAFTESAPAGSDSLFPVVPSTQSLTGVFAPASDQSWLTIGTIAAGVVDFAFTANTSSTARTAHISVLGRQITVTQNGSLAAQTISFTSLVNKSLGVPSFPLSATASSGLTVRFASNSTSVCTVSGVNVTLVAVGICSITATQPGDSTYAAGTPVTQTFNVTAAAASYGVTGQVTLPGALASLPLSGVAITLTGAAPTSTDASGDFSFSGLAPGGNYTVTPSKNGYTFNPPSVTFTSLAASQTANFGAIPNGSQYAITEYAVPTAGSWPDEMAVGPDGAIWFTEYYTNRIGRIAGNGAITEYPIPTPAAGPGGIAAGPDGAMWFTEEAANQIGRITMAGVITGFSGLFAGGASPNGSSLPNGIAAGPDGALWFTEYAENAERIGRITTSGVVTEYAGLAGGNRAAPWGIVAGPDGAMWFTEAYGNRIGRISTSGAITEYPLAAGPGAYNTTGPIWIAVGPDGALWFTQQENSQIGRITTAGAITEHPVPTAGSYPNVGIAAGPDGAMWFNEGTGNNIGRITTAGVITEYPVPTAGAYPTGIVAGPDGAMWFAEGNGNNIGRIALAGAYGTANLAASGTVTPLTNTANGNPSDITQPGGYWNSYYSAYDGYTNASAFTLDLGAVHSIGRIDLVPTQVFGFRVWTSTDGSTWTQRAGYDWPTWMFFPVSIPANGNYSARYIKYEGYSNWNQYVGVSGLQVYEWLTSGPPIGAYGGTDIALNASVTAVAPDASNPAAIADGNPTTSWTGAYLPYADTGSPSYCAGSAAAPYPYCWAYGYARIDLGQSLPIGKIQVTPTSVQGYAVYLYQNISDTVPRAYAAAGSPGLWTTSNFDANPATFYFNGTAHARYIVVTPMNTTPGDPVFPSLNEVQVYAWSPLSVTSTHSGSFTQGQTGATYTVTVQNVAGAGPTSGAVTVTETLPSGLTLVSMAGTGWDCSAAPSCTRSDVLADGAAYQPITVTVNVTASAASPQVNQVSVSGGGSAPANASDATVIITGGPALSASKTHTGNFTQGQNGVTYTIVVSNGSSGGPTTGTVTVTDSPTSGLTPVSMSGNGWTCDSNFGVGCTRSDVLAPGASYPAITVTMNVAANATSPQINQAIVTGGGLLNPVLTGDMATVTPVPALSIGSAHVGSFAQGQTGAAYTVTVSNSASGGPTTSAVTVTESVPSGLTLMSMSGNGWTCPSAGTTCTRSDALAPGASYPSITVNVNVVGNAGSPQVNAISVSGGGSVAASATDSTTIVGNPPLLSITSAHTGSFTQGQSGAAYTLTVSNQATASSTSSVVTVTDTLPSGLTLVSMSGTGWSCPAGGNTCHRIDPLAAGASYAPITVTVNVAANAASPQVNAVSVSLQGTVVSSFTDSTTITPAAALGSNSILVGSAAGSSSVILTAPGAWTAAANSSFLHVAAPSAGGTGNAVVIFTYDALTGTGTRTGTLTIAGLTLTVTQAGTNYLSPGPVTTLASSGLSQPEGVAVDGSGNVYMADPGNAAIYKWSAPTQQVTTLVSSGLAYPSGVAVDGSGNVYIADMGNSAIKVWSAPTQQVTTLVSSGLNWPAGVALDGSGNVYIADTQNSEIKEWNAATQQVTTLASSGLNCPNGVAVDSLGNVYIADTQNNEIKEWSASTQQVTTLVSSGLSYPSGVAVDGSGNVYIADMGHDAIEEWSASTQQVTTLVSSGLGLPGGVAVDGSGNVYVADSGNHAIKELPYAFVGPAAGLTEPAAAGADSSLPVIPSTQSLIGVFAPTSDQTWLTIGTPAGGVVNFSFTANASSSTRAAHISILGQQITVTQSAPAALTSQTITFGALPGQVLGAASFTINATATSGLAVTLTSTTLSVCGVTGNTVTILTVGSCSITASQAGNTTYAAAAPVTQSFSVSATCTYALNPTAASFAAPGGTGTVAVSTQAACPWTAPTNQSWLTVTSGGSGTGSGTVNYSVSPNPAAPRSGALTIGGQTFGVTQLASYLASTIAGGTFPATPISGNSVTLPASYGMATDPAGNLYLAAWNWNAAFKLDTAGILTRVAGGSPIPGFSGDGGPALDAQLSSPWAVTADSSGNLYIADTSNCRVRKVTPLGTISTVAGSATCGNSGDGGPATSAQLSAPYGMAVDASGNLYIADNSNSNVRKVKPNGVISTVAGNGTPGFAGDTGPAAAAELNGVFSVAVDASGNLYIADTNNVRVRMVAPNGTITTVAGNGTAGYSGDGGSATAAELMNPLSVAVDSSGNLYIGDDGNSTVRKVTTSGAISTVAGNGAYITSSGGDGGPATSAPLNGLGAIAVDASGNLFLSTADNRVRIVSPAGVIGTVVGKSETSAYGLLTPVNGAAAVASDSAGNVYFTDTWNNRIRKVSPDGTVVTVAGTGVNGAAGDSGPAVGAQLGNVFGVALDAAGDIYIVDTGNSTIRKVDTNGVITTVAGNGTAGYSGDNGPATAAQLNLPYGVAVDASGNLYIADRYNYRVRKVDTAGVITTVAGNGTQGYSGDGSPATSAELGIITGLAIGPNGGIYVADRYEHRVRKIGSSGVITTYAGNGTSGYSGDGGPATSARLSHPSGLALDSSGNLFIGDGPVVRVVSRQGTITTVAGTGSTGDSGDGGLATAAAFQYAYGLSVDAAGRVYVADVTSNAVRLLTPVGTQPVFSIAGLPSSFTDGQNGTLALTISNVGQAASTSGLVAVAPIAPSGLSGTSMSGSGWTCGTTTCTRADSLSAGASFPAITINLGVAATAKSQATLAALVSGGGSNATGAEGLVGVLPVAPSQPWPAEAGAGVALTTPLSWTASAATDSCDVYFGTSNPPPLAGSTAGLTFNPGTLAYNQTYYWQVVARNLAGSATSAIWSFTTLSNSLTSQTITFGALADRPYGTAAFTIGATASSGLAVGFTSTTPSVCSVSTATVTLLAVGACAIQATQSGNATYAAAAPVTQRFTVFPVPSLAIAKSHTGNFNQGQIGAAYSIVVSNAAVSAGPTVGAVTVTDGPTSGLTLASMSGTGWTCDPNVAAGCTRGDALAPGASYPPITVLVNVAANATSPQINQGILAGGGLLNPIVTGDMAVIATASNTLSAASASAGPGATFSIPVTLSMLGGVSANAVTFGLQVVPNASAPALTGTLAFTRNASITDVPLVGANGTTNQIGVVWSSLTTPITGSVQLGVVTGTLPATAATGQSYSIQITGAGATDGSGNALTVAAGSNATLNVAITYLVGDVAPYTSDSAPNFGDGNLNILDLIQELFAVNNIPGFRPATCSDRFDAMDLYPADAASARGGDGVLDIRDLILELFRVNNLDNARPVRASMGGALPWAACSSGSSGNSAPATTALSRTTAAAPGVHTPAMGTLTFGRPEPYGAATERMPVYLQAARNLSRVAVTFALGDRQSRLSFTPSPDTPASLASDSQLGVVAAAWLNGLTVPARGRLLLGYVTGPTGALYNLSVYGASASSLDDNSEVPLAHN